MDRSARRLLVEGWISKHIQTRERIAERSPGPDAVPRSQPIERFRIDRTPTLVAELSERQLKDMNRQFVPNARFKIKNDKNEREVRQEFRHSPRPTDWLEDFRCDPDNPLTGNARHVTAIDQALLEVLISVAREESPTYQYKVNEVKLEDIAPLIASAASMKAIEESLARLQTTSFSLPVLRVPAKRISAKRRYLADAAKNDDLDYRDAAKNDLLHITDPEAPYRSVDPQLFDTSRDPIPTRRIRHVAPSRSRKSYLLEKPAVAEASWRNLKLDSRMKFVPVRRWCFVDSYLVFELSDYMRFFLNSFREVRQKRVPYSYIDHDLMIQWRSPYTPSIYRFLCAKQFDSLKGKSRVGTTVTELSFQEVIKISGYRLQKGGYRGQVKRNLLKGICSDFAAASTAEFCVTTELMDDEIVRFFVTASPDIRNLGMKFIHVLEKSVRGSRSREVNMSRQDFSRLSPPDIDALFVSPRTFAKINYRLGYTGNEIFEFSIAWRIAVFEALIAEDELTSGSNKKPLRCGRLLRALCEFGPDRVAFQFALAEADEPDLTTAYTLRRLQAEGLEERCNKDRILRLQAAKRRDPSIWSSRADEIARNVSFRSPLL